MRLEKSVLLLPVLFLAIPGHVQEIVIGGPCEGCEWVYVDMPKDIRSRTRIAPTGEPGEPLTLEGTVYTSAGRPASGIVVYAYHTNAEGIYPGGVTRHGSLRGWTMTDARGRYRFDTIRPSAYPSRDEPAHIHMHVIEPDRGTYYIDDVTFTDDPLLLLRPQNQLSGARGGSGQSTPFRDTNGTLRVQRDIHLGLNIPGY